MALEQRANLAGKNAIIIGGAFGIGEAVTLALADAGVNIALCDNDAEALPGTVAAAETRGVQVYSQCFDALDTKALDAFYQEVATRFGHLDIVVNVVGGTYMQRFETTGPDVWAHEIHRNFGYVLHSTKAALPLLRKSGRGGSIINFTTIEAHRGAASLAVYAGAKAATTNFSRAMAVELGPDRIRVNTLASDLTATRGNANATKRERQEGMIKLPAEVVAKGVAIATPLGTPPTLDEIANGVLFLASDLSSGITGTVLHVDGGTYAAAGFNLWPFGDEWAPIPLDNTLRQMFRDDIPAGT